jgi:hypothetical protein
LAITTVAAKARLLSIALRLLARLLAISAETGLLTVRAISWLLHTRLLSSVRPRLLSSVRTRLLSSVRTWLLWLVALRIVAAIATELLLWLLGSIALRVVAAVAAELLRGSLLASELLLRGVS